MMIGKEAIDKIEELSLGNAKIQQIEELPFAPSSYRLIKTPEVKSLDVMSLTSLIEFVKQSGLEVTAYMYHVLSPTEVHIVSKAVDKYSRRAQIACADVTKQMDSMFSYGRDHDLEEFIVGVQSAFERTENRDKLIDAVSSIRVGEEDRIEDDGFNQTVSSKAGAHLNTRVTLPNPIVLKPYKSFPEIAPVEESFIFRVSKARRKEDLAFRLYAPSSMLWELDCVKKIKQFLDDSSTLPTI